MASLRDVLDHAGKRVRVRTGRLEAREGLCVRRGDLLLVEPKLAPLVGDVVEFVDAKESFLILVATPEQLLGKVDHYRCKAAPFRG